MNIIEYSHPTQDGDGVNIERIAAFKGQKLDPFLMIDEIRSDDSSDYIGGFPPHPHRGIETFTYIKKGGFEHRDQLGNVKAIRAGDIQWMSTGSGVIHSEMPLADSEQGLHGFQIWLNMPAKDKMRPARYYDSAGQDLPTIRFGLDSHLKALAGQWQTSAGDLLAPLNDLAGHGAIADLCIQANDSISVILNPGEQLAVFCYEGGLESVPVGSVARTSQTVTLKAAVESQCLLLRGTPINEAIVHMGPFVMNTQQEIQQAIADYRAGRFGSIS